MHAFVDMPERFLNALMGHIKTSTVTNNSIKNIITMSYRLLTLFRAEYRTTLLIYWEHAACTATVARVQKFSQHIRLFKVIRFALYYKSLPDSIHVHVPVERYLYPSLEIFFSLLRDTRLPADIYPCPN